MKIASRFPVKESKGLRSLVLILHLVVFILSYLALGLGLIYFIVVISILLSTVYSIKRLKSITQAPDDLCWSGEKWLFNIPNRENELAFNETAYLQIQPTSWVTQQYCLLKFKTEMNYSTSLEFALFFSASNLGDRLYRELCYLANQTLQEQTREESKNIG